MSENNNPLIHTEYIEIVTAEDLVNPIATVRANKVVATDSTGFIPEQLIPSTLAVSSIEVTGASLTGDVKLEASGTLTITADVDTGTITIENTAISSINGIDGEVTLVPDSPNVFIYADLDTNQIKISDELIKLADNASEVEEVIQETTVDGQGRITQVDTYHRYFAELTGTLKKSVTFDYDSLNRLTTETLILSGKQIVKTYEYPPSGSLLPEEIPISWSKIVEST